MEDPVLIATKPILDDKSAVKGGLRRSSGYLEQERPSKRSKRVPMFPVSNADFEDFVTHPNVFYVDKTRYIPELEPVGKAVMLLAPRRFGKTLFLDTLANYYDVSKLDRFENLFGKLWIGSHVTETANKYHILKMSFGGKMGRSSASSFGSALSNRIQWATVDFCRRYDLKMTGTALSLVSLCENLKERNEKVCVAIEGRFLVVLGSVY